MKNILVPIMAIIVLSSCAVKETNYPLRIAEEYGVKQFDKIKSIEFEFNVEVPTKSVQRHWQWLPANDKVIYYGVSDTVAFFRNQQMSEEEVALDKKFINDSYWLLFPLHLKWDSSNYTYSLVKDVKSPINNSNTDKLVVEYINADGYTPNDIYELFITDKNEIVEWIFRKGGSVKPTKIVTWEETIQNKGLQFSTLHNSKDGKFKLWFEDVRVELN